MAVIISTVVMAVVAMTISGATSTTGTILVIIARTAIKKKKDK